MSSDSLATLITEYTDEPMWSAVVIAKRILTSDWLTAHDAQVRADERQKVDTLLREQREGVADEGGLPSHLPIGVTKDGQGPEDDSVAHHFVCWCGSEECMWNKALAWASGEGRGLNAWRAIAAQRLVRAEKAEELARIIREGVGSASMCWEHVERAGVFDDRKANEVADRIEAEVRAHYAALLADEGTVEKVAEAAFTNGLRSVRDASAYTSGADDDMPRLTDDQCSRIVTASIAPGRVFSGQDGHEGSEPDVLLTVVRQLLAAQREQIAEAGQ